MWNAVLDWLPGAVRAALARLPSEWTSRAEEIRIRDGRPLEVVAAHDFTFVDPTGRPTRDAEAAFRPTRDDCLKLLDRVTNHSVYTMEEQLRRGYITVAGGHRIGLAGRAALEDGRIRTLQHIGGFNVRIAREVKGCARSLVPLLWNAETSMPHHTLIVSPPQRGKTTLLRDAARTLSAGGWAGGVRYDRARKVGIVDERSEIAASVDGRPTFDVGPRTDVLDACPKAEGMMLMIRALSPEVLVVDELGRPEDAEAAMEAVHAGIAVIATAHGKDASDVRRRPSLAPLFEARAFGRIVILAPSGPSGVVLEVRDGEGRRLSWPTAPGVGIGAGHSERKGATSC
ncbi:stage III sporulation protein AA [Paenibacillus sp.]|uniref:stage III sporulation protein AA n=1 Tax=Paenibacillus sp. TaxID=58172 RepID=UPI002D2B17DF|nr:stage III sporulation protein AA [Paenibacillus sp.]HZG58064.1 stage III sporulation protein AA [Paenibacillus sp.]